MTSTDLKIGMEMYTPEEVGKILKISTAKVQDLCRKGELRASKVGRLYRISDEDLKEYLDSNKNV